MSAVQTLQDRLEGTNALIARYQKALQDPSTSEADASALSVNLRSLRKVRERLEAQFLQVATLQSLEVYRYRLLIGEEAPTLAGVGEAWAKLQEFFASVYKALTSPKAAVKRTGTQAFAVPELGYSYSFPGSVGVVVTLPRNPPDTALLDKSPVEEASNIVFNLIETKNVQAVARSLGPEPIRAMNEWLAVHVQHHYGLALEWHADNSLRREATATYAELVDLQNVVIDTKSRETLNFVGLLSAVDTDKRTFRVKTDSKEEFEGSYEEGVIQESHAASVPSRYAVTILKVTDLISTTGKVPKPELFLERLEPL